MAIRTLKEVLHDQVHSSDLKMNVLAEQLGMSYSYLANAVNPNLEDFHFQIRHLIPLLKLTKDRQVLDYIESAVGRVAFELPDVVDSDHSKLNEELCKTIKEFGDLTSEVGKSLADGKVRLSEAKIIEKETMELVVQALVFLKVIQRIAK